MASSLLKPSRLIALVLIIVAGGWVVSGYLASGEEKPKPDTKQTEEVPIQKVTVIPVTNQSHRRQVIMSCVTKADQQAIATARGAGVLINLKVERGSTVKAGDVIAAISDEGREAAVSQAQALLDQRMSEYNANKKLIQSGDISRNTLPSLEAAVAAAKAALAAAQAEADRSIVRAPVDGIVNAVPVQVGQAIQAGTEIADIVSPDPMLAVGAASERQRPSLSVGQHTTVRFIDDTKVEGKVSFVALSGDAATRTYRVEARIPNPTGSIADGVTCEMAVDLEPQQAAPVPRSALVFSDSGELGVRIADEDNKARFIEVSVVDDTQDVIWVSGLDANTRVITVGQDFVKDGDVVDPVVQGDGIAQKAEQPPA